MFIIPYYRKLLELWIWYIFFQHRHALALCVLSGWQYRILYQPSFLCWMYHTSDATYIASRRLYLSFRSGPFTILGHTHPVAMAPLNGVWILHSTGITITRRIPLPSLPAVRMAPIARVQVFHLWASLCVLPVSVMHGPAFALAQAGANAKIPVGTILMMSRGGWWTVVLAPLWQANSWFSCDHRLTDGWVSLFVWLYSNAHSPESICCED